MHDAILDKLKNQYPQEQYEIIKKAYDFGTRRAKTSIG